jgi:hypothetical protein
MGCLKTYTVMDVKGILNYSEGDSPNVLRVETQKVSTLFGEMTLAMHSNEKTGHAQERHLVITEAGLRERTLATGTGEGLAQASAFLSDKMANLITVITALLNCQKGQEALAALDAYGPQGKTRVVVVEDASVLKCTQINARVFYQGDSKSKVEKLSRAAMVLDSNIGGKFPFKIVTAFPCKENPFLEVTLSDVMVQCRDLTKAGQNPFAVPVRDLIQKVEAWARKSSKKIPSDLLHGNTLVVGTIRNSGWFEPNPALYKYKYPISEDRDADDRLDKKPNYDRDLAGKAPEKRMSIPMVQEQAEAAKLRLLEVDARTKLGIFLLR